MTHTREENLAAALSIALRLLVERQSQIEEMATKNKSGRAYIAATRETTAIVLRIAREVGVDPRPEAHGTVQ